MGNRPKAWLGTCLAVSLMLGLTACGQHASIDGSEIALGIDLPVSGADTTDGVPTRNGVILAIEEANAMHRFGPKITLVANDLDDAVNGKHDPAQGAQNVKTFIADDRVLAMIGPFNSSVATAEIPLTNDAGLAEIAPSTTANKLTQGPEALQLRKSHPDTNTFFRVCAPDSRQGPAGAKFALSLDHHRIYIIDDNETYGAGLAASFEKSFTDHGGTVLGHEHITANQQDFKALLTKVAAAKPDLVFYGGTTSTGGGLLRKQMGDVGMEKVAFMGGDGISDPEFLTVAGDLANNTIYTVASPDASHLTSSKLFTVSYEARFKQPVGAYSANAYVAAKIAIAGIAAAIKDAKGEVPTRAAVLAKIAATKDFASILGPIGFDKNGDSTSPIVSLYRITAGKPVFVMQNTVE